MTEKLACRGCRHLLTADVGCGLCLPVKAHLIVENATDEDTVPLATVAAEAVVLLRKQLTQLKAAQKTPSYDAAISGEVRAVANALAKLLDSARKVVQDGADAVASMSFQERASLFLEWTGSLPAAYRRRLIESLETQGDRPASTHKDGSDVTIN